MRQYEKQAVQNEEKLKKELNAAKSKAAEVNKKEAALVQEKLEL